MKTTSGRDRVQCSTSGARPLSTVLLTPSAAEEVKGERGFAPCCQYGPDWRHEIEDGEIGVYMVRGRVVRRYVVVKP